MKRIIHKALSFLTFSALTFAVCSPMQVSAATKADVIAAADAIKQYDPVQYQNAMNILASRDFTSEDYDKMLAGIEQYKNSYNTGVNNGLSGSGNTSSDDSTSSGQDSSSSGNDSSSGTSDSSSESASPSNPTINDMANEYVNMTPEEKQEYIDNLTPEQKKEIIKGLDNDQKMEILNSIIAVGDDFGMHVTVDDFKDNSFTYSIRDAEGKVVDISSVGVIVDDTGIDYSRLIIICGSVVLLSCAGVASLAYIQNHRRKTSGGTDNE